MRSKRINKMWFGFFLGLFVPLIGALVFYYSLLEYSSFSEFIAGIQDSYIFPKITSLGATFNLLLFFIFIWTNNDLAARGVVLSTVLYGLLTVALKVSA